MTYHPLQHPTIETKFGPFEYGVCSDGSVWMQAENFKINGIEYRRAYASTGRDAYTSLTRADSREPTSAARSALWQLIREVAPQLATPEKVARALVAERESKVNYADVDARKAARDYEQAKAAHLAAVEALCKLIGETSEAKRAECPSVSKGAKWSGGFEVPVIGERLRVKFNQLGAGTVAGYFVAHGYLGLRVDLDQQPEWHARQNPGQPWAFVFGAEVAPL